MTLNLNAKKRTPGNAATERANNLIPAVVYGPEISPLSIALVYNDFNKLYQEAGEATLIDVQVEGEAKPITVLVQEVEHDPISQRITHVDLRQISMTKEMHAEVVLRFIGEAPAVRELGGTLVKTHDHLNVKCLPKDLVNHLDVDLSVLKTFAENIHVKDLQIPAGIQVLDNPELVLAKVQAALTEEELKAMEEEGKKGVETVEVEKKGKEEGVADAAAATTDKKDEKK